MTLVLAGRFAERVGRVEETARPLSLVVKPGGTVHSDTFGPAVATLQLAINPCEQPALSRIIPALSSWRWLHAGPATRAFLILADVVASAKHGPTPGSRELIDRAAYDALAALSLDDARRPTGRRQAGSELHAKRSTTWHRLRLWHVRALRECIPFISRDSFAAGTVSRLQSTDVENACNLPLRRWRHRASDCRWSRSTRGSRTTRISRASLAARRDWHRTGFGNFPRRMNDFWIVVHSSD